MKRIAIVFAAMLFSALAWLTYTLNDHPSLAPYPALWLAPAEPAAGQLRVTWLGVSTLLIDDGETAIMTDGFFTRPGLLKMAINLSPNKELVAQSLARAGVKNLAAVLVVHSHYDHVMDSPEVAQQTGAVLVGSESTVNVGRGWGLPEDRMIAVKGGEELKLGKFKVMLIKSQHFPHGKLMGEIMQPLVSPARASAYLEGGSYSIHIEHGNRRMLVQGSAGFVEGAMDNYPADVVFLGIGLLGTKDIGYQTAYWNEVVQATGAQRVIPIHWDDFFRPLDQPLVPLPSLLDDFDGAMQFILLRGNEQGVNIKLARAWQRIDPFAGL